MDILTQGLLGAVVAQTVSKPDEARKAGWTGFISGLLADVDVLIRSSTDPLLILEFHRHFTHSVFFIPVGALIAALILYPFFKNNLAFQRVYLYAFAGFSLSGAIDACTSYGTYLFWPVIDERISLNIISIIDPVFTLALLIAFIVVIVRQQPRPAALSGLAFCGIYLVVAQVQQGRVEDEVQQLAASRGHKIEKMIIKPTLGNIILWRSTYISNGRVVADAIRAGLADRPRIIQGASVPVFVPERDMPLLEKNSLLYIDIQRFIRLSDGFVARKPGSKHIIGDARYAMLPNSLEPLWGIVVDPDLPDKHVKYDTFRDNSKQLRQAFFTMLFR